MTRGPRFGASVIPAVVLLGAMATTGCVVLPIRMTTRVEGPERTKEALPKEAVVPGGTTRAEVEARFKAFAVDPGVTDVFWGRFRKSSWAVVYAWGVGTAGGGVAGAGGAGGGRTWGVYNLLVTFDPRGVARSSALVPEKELQTHLARVAIESAAPPLDLSEPLLVEGLVPDASDRIRAIEVQLMSTGLAVMKYAPWKSRTTAAPLPISTLVPLDQIEGLQVGDARTDEPGRVKVELRFKRRTEVGRRVRFWAEPRWASVFVRWRSQVGLQ